MYQKIQLPENGCIQPVPSKRDVPSAKAVESANRALEKLRSAKGSTYLASRHVAVDDTGTVLRTYNRICTGGMGQEATDISTASLLAFAMPGETQSIGQMQHNGYKYSDDKDSDGRLWARFILDPQKSPWRAALPWMRSIDPEEVYSEKQVDFHHIDTLPTNAVRLWMMAARWPLEGYGKFVVWAKAVREGLDPALAFLVMANTTYSQVYEDGLKSLIAFSPPSSHIPSPYMQRYTGRNFVNGHMRSSSFIAAGHPTAIELKAAGFESVQPPSHYQYLKYLSKDLHPKDANAPTAMSQSFSSTQKVDAYGTPLPGPEDAGWKEYDAFCVKHQYGGNYEAHQNPGKNGAPFMEFYNMIDACDRSERGVVVPVAVAEPPKAKRVRRRHGITTIADVGTIADATIDL